MLSVGGVDESRPTRQTAIRHFFVDVLPKEYRTANTLLATDTSTTGDSRVSSSQLSQGVVGSGNDGAPRNKNLKLLDEMESSVASSNVVDDNVRNEQALQLEITMYLGPVAVTEEEKLLPLKFWKRNAKVYPHLSLIARIFLTPSASSVPV